MSDQESVVTLLNQQGVELFQQGNVPGAVRTFREALALAPRDAAIHANLGLVLGRENDAAGALPHLTTSFAASQEDPHVTLALVKALVTLEQPEAARTVYRTYLGHCPDDTEVSGALAGESWSMDVDPTVVPLVAPGSTIQRCRDTYREAFLRCFEFIASNQVQGDVLEFGTYRGFTARIIASLLRQVDSRAHLYLFDSFEGLPELRSEVDRRSYESAETRVWFKGQMELPTGIEDRISGVLSSILSPQRVHVVKGFFEATVPDRLPSTQAALVHLDCDLYESTRLVLTHLMARDLLQDGTVLAFDDFNCGRASPRLGQRRALTDVFGAQSRFGYSSFFPYGWHGHAFFVHDLAG